MKNLPYIIGTLISTVAHIVFGIAAIFMLHANAASAVRPREVFTVTLDGGKALGGISQVPKATAEKTKVLPKGPAEIAPEKKAPEKKAVEKKIDKPTVVDAVAKKKAAEKKAAELKATEKKKQEQAKKEKAEAEKKKAADDKKKKVEDEKRSAQERKEREKRIQEAVNRAKQYDGESSNAGGEGFNAARIGGSGMGGGTLASAEFIAYMNALERHIKDGWHWGLPTKSRLQAVVVVRLMPTGVVQDARITGSSGNSRFDDSVLRAVYKASPVPAPPNKLYNKFREVRITFDSQHS